MEKEKRRQGVKAFVQLVHESFKKPHAESIARRKLEGDEIIKANGYSKRPDVKRSFENLNGRMIISVDGVPFFKATAAARYIVKQYKMTAEHAIHFVMEEF